MVAIRNEIPKTFMVIMLFHTFHHLLQQWTEAEEEDGCNSCHDSKECEEVCEVGDLIAKE